VEFTIAWFWVLKLILIIIPIVLLWISYIFHKKKNSFWKRIFFILAILGMIFNLFMPIKIDSTNSRQGRTLQTYSVESNKVLPPRVVDNSFKRETGSKNLKITKDEIWK